ncbi:MAG: CotH kinase family protein [Crocinitomicaceae bacterium]|nr:CotH kinase family protein [Crocinitomicaceae bacterium]
MLRLLVVLCIITGISSFQNVRAQSGIDHWETVVYETDTWKYIVPTSTVDPAWNTLGFSTASWNTGPGGFGYGDGDDNTILPNGTVSVFHRITFNIIDTSDIAAAALTMDFDDGFVAYLNGVEITRQMMVGNVQPDYNQLASGLHEAEAYQGLYPYQFAMSEAFLDSVLNLGSNVLAVQTHNEAAGSSDLSSRAFLHVGIKSAVTNYSATPGWFEPPIIFTESNLPIVVINTDNGATIPDEPKINAEMGIIYNGDGVMNNVNDPFNEFYGDIGIERRGSSSQGFPKKPYAIETRGPDSSNYNVSIFNWPADNDWALIAPYSDKSLIRNVLTYKLGNDLGNYSPRTKLCELILNDEYMGVYVLTERIKQNPGRVNVDKLEYADTIGNELSGGYIVKIDKTTGGGIVAWNSPIGQAPPATGQLRYQLHDPDIDTIHPLQLNYIQNYITDFEYALDGPNFSDPVLGYEAYIDVPSFIDFMIINEISKNVDGYRISTFYHKEHISDGGKLKAGPLWDFNLAWGNANYCQGGQTTGWEIYFNDVCGNGGPLNNPFHWNRFVEDPDFTYALNCRWQELRQDELHTDSILTYIDELAFYLEDAADRNFSRWQILGMYVWPNNFVGNTYQEEIDYLKTWVVDRINWMDANMFGSCPNLAVNQNTINTRIFPNPTQNYLQLQFSEPVSNIKWELNDISGRIVQTGIFTQGNQFTLDLSALTAGIYTLNLYLNNEKVTNEKIIKQ